MDPLAFIYGRIDDDGLMRVTCVEGYYEFQEWISAGNVPEQLTAE